jgi:hypothetical protein
VIVIGSLRVAGVDYATTILDAAPFGVLFATVVMSYMLSWLVEYWINRTIGVELLAVLGDDAERTAMSCDLPAPVNPQIHVAPQGRILAYHGLGRFLVAGRPHRQHVAEGAAPRPAPPSTATICSSFSALSRDREPTSWAKSCARPTSTSTQ